MLNVERIHKILKYIFKIKYREYTESFSSAPQIGRDALNYQLIPSNVAH